MNAKAAATTAIVPADERPRQVRRIDLITRPVQFAEQLVGIVNQRVERRPDISITWLQSDGRISAVLEFVDTIEVEPDGEA